MLDILDGKSVKEVLSESDEEDSSDFVGSIAINVETGKVEGIDDIKDSQSKKNRFLAAVSKVVEELGGN